MLCENITLWKNHVIKKVTLLHENITLLQKNCGKYYIIMKKLHYYKKCIPRKISLYEKIILQKSHVITWKYNIITRKIVLCEKYDIIKWKKLIF